MATRPGGVMDSSYHAIIGLTDRCYMDRIEKLSELIRVHPWFLISLQNANKKAERPSLKHTIHFKKMKLVQKQGRKHDTLELEDDRILHSWSLGKEKGERSTELANIDPNFAHTERKSEGKLPYFVIGFLFLLLILIYPPDESLIERVIYALFILACISSFLVGLFTFGGKKAPPFCI